MSLQETLQKEYERLKRLDAEIEGLKAQVESSRVELREQWERMQKENLAAKHLITEKDKLIAELAEALATSDPSNRLLLRAKKATRG